MVVLRYNSLLLKTLQRQKNKSLFLLLNILLYETSIPVFCFHFSLFAFSQYMLPSEEISLIGYSEDFAHLSFYRQHTDGKYEEVYLNFKEYLLCKVEEKRNNPYRHNTIETLSWDYRGSQKDYPLDKLFQKEMLISITELFPTDYHTLQGKHYLCEKKATEKLYFQFVNP